MRQKDSDQFDDMRTRGDWVCVVLVWLVLKHCESRGTIVNRQWSGERLRRVTSFHNFHFFNRISVDVSLGSGAAN